MNDHSPVFTDKYYSFVIRENTELGATVGQVTASDADKVSGKRAFILIL